MRAVLCKEWGPPDALVVEDVPSPKPGKGQVLISVKASGVNFPDVLLIQNKYQFKPELPFSPGSEIAGVVKQVGEGVHGFMPGDRVMAHIRSGGYAEEAVVDEALLAPVPAGLDFTVAASFGLVYATAYHALKHRAAIRAGETLLVLGPALGRGRSPLALRKIPVTRTMLKGCSIGGVFGGEFARRERDLNAANLKELTAWLRARKIKPLVSASYPLERAADALNDMMNRKVQGKVVLTTE